MVHLPVTQKDSIVDQVEQLWEDIAQRAYALFVERGVWKDAWTDWFAAEREIVQHTRMELRERDGVYVASARLAGFDPQDIRIDITPTDLVIKAKRERRLVAQNGDVHPTERKTSRVFRALHFPKPVDSGRARAVCENGLLLVTVPIALDRRGSRPAMNVAGATTQV